MVFWLCLLILILLRGKLHLWLFFFFFFFLRSHVFLIFSGRICKQFQMISRRTFCGGVYLGEYFFKLNIKIRLYIKISSLLTLIIEGAWSYFLFLRTCFLFQLYCFCFFSISDSLIVFLSWLFQLELFLSDLYYNI